MLLNDFEKDLLNKVLKPVYLDQSTGELVWLDVSKIPWEETWIRSRDVERVAKAIENMEIRGAPAIGVTAALTLAMVVLNNEDKDVKEIYEMLEKAAKRITLTRPTAYNLFWAVERVMSRARELLKDNVEKDLFKKKIVEEALKIQEEDLVSNILIGRYGSELIEDGDTILTHCNTGSLATAGFGTALGVIRYAWAQGKRISVIATETRPLLQGSRLTVWELHRDKIPVKLITDNMVGYVMKKRLVNKVIVGADRILRTGHVANKIGTYSIAILASYHKTPFYVAAPTSTIDMKTDPDKIVIEERDPDEVRSVMKKIFVSIRDVDVYNPAFDVTPPDLISAIITERGIAKPPYDKSLKKLF